MDQPVALAVDDDPDMCATLARALRAFGFRVLTAEDGPAALALASAEDGPIRLLVTDIEMPGPTGGEVAQALGATRPEMAVLFVSGRPAPRDLSDAVRGRAAAFLPKPFTVEALRTAVVHLVGPLPTADRRR